MRRLYWASSPPKSSPRCRSASGASIQARAGMLRSRCGVAGRSSVWTGVSSSGRSSYRRCGLPAAVDPLLEVRLLVADRGVVAVTGHDDRVRRQGEQAVFDGTDDRGEVATLELGGAGTARKQGVAGEDDRRALDLEAHRAGRVARRVDGVQTQTPHFDDRLVLDDKVV